MRDLVQSDAHGIQRIRDRKGGSNGGGKEHFAVDAVAPVRQIGVTVGKLRGLSGGARTGVAKGVGADQRADPLGIGIVNECGTLRRNTGFQIVERSQLRCAGDGKMLLPVCADVGGGKVLAIAFHDQKREDDVGHVIVYRAAVHAGQREKRPAVMLKGERPRTLHGMPVFLRRELHAAGPRHVFHIPEIPHLHRRAEHATGEAAEERRLDAAVQIPDRLRRPRLAARGGNPGVIVRLVGAGGGVLIEPAEGLSAFVQRGLQILVGGSGLRRVAAVFQRECACGIQNIELGFVFLKVEVFHIRSPLQIWFLLLYSYYNKPFCTYLCRKEEQLCRNE